MALSDELTNRKLRQWAGSRSFERGRAYFDEGHVTALKEHKGTVRAVVAGTHPYRVKLWEDEDTVDYACDCPVGMRGEFCKHCVATALAWLESNSAIDAEGSPKKSKKDKTGLTARELRAWLSQQKKAFLVDMLLEAASENELLHNRLMLSACATGGVNARNYKAIIKQAVGVKRFIDYYQMHDYWRGVDSAIDAVENLLSQGHADVVIELTEYALACVEKAIERVDDSDGYMSLILERLQEIHFIACREAKPDPVLLGGRLFLWELNGAWDIFHGAVTTYSEVLAEKGVQHYRKMAEVEWAKVKPLKAGGRDPDQYGKRFRITRIMERLAELSGDLDELIQVKQRDLSYSHHYLEIAEIYSKARQRDRALEWAEKGLRLFGKESGVRLQDFVTERYHRLKRHEEAVSLVWSQFQQSPGLEGYQKLKKHADRNKSWAKWRSQALTHLRTKLTKELEKTAGSRSGYAFSRGYTDLVGIFIWERDFDAAWQEANQGGCSKSLWFKLAALREKAHPQDAITVYKRHIGPIIDQTNNEAYLEAKGILKKIERLMNRLGKQDEFKEYLEAVRVEYKRKRNFIKLLTGFA